MVVSGTVPPGVKLSDKGLIEVETSNEFAETKFKLNLTIGSQSLEKEFTVEVFDCNSHLVYAPSLNVQMGNKT